MLIVLGGLAEFERELIRARTGEGRERAKAKGVKMGRKPKLTDHQKREAIKRRDKGEPMREIARTFQRLAQHDFEIAAVNFLLGRLKACTRISNSVLNSSRAIYVLL